MNANTDNQIEKLDRITELLFISADRIHRFSREAICNALAEFGVELHHAETFVRFDYHDEEKFSCVFSFWPSGKIATISLSLHLLNDEKGWDAWSKDREMERLRRQAIWMRSRGITESSDGSQRVSNCFSPQDGCSSITIVNPAK